MHYYLDAYNLLFHLTSTTHCLESERQQLIDMIAHLIAPRKLKVTLVFDGSGSIEYPQKFVTQDVEIVYTTGGQNADNYILEKVSSKKHRSPVTVVTNDKSLGRLVRHYGGKVLSVDNFIHHQQKKRRKKQHFSEPYLSPIGEHTSHFSESARYLEIFQERFREIETQVLKTSKKYKQWLEACEDNDREQ